jgi:DNA-binding protein HU-beta
MATGLTKTALIRLLAEKLELTNKQVAAFFEIQAETAVKETKKNGARPASAATPKPARPSRSRPRPSSSSAWPRPPRT